MPPKKKNKKSKSGYWEFVLEIRDKNPNKFANIQEASECAARKWTTMSKEERRPYEERALLNANGARTVKYTTDGLNVEDVERQEREIAEKRQEMKSDIDNNLKIASRSGTLDEEMFLIIHINHLIHYPAEDKYFICEIAIAAFNLKNGIDNVFHRIVKPGALPLGYRGGALAHSKETHQMFEIVIDDANENNTQEVFYDVIRFMKKYSKERKLPILYADEKTLEMSRKVFSYFCHVFNFSERMKIYNLQSMFFALRNAAANKTVWPTETFSYAEIEKDVYCFTTNLSCDYHEVTDISLYCSKSIVTRYAFVICDNCCTDLNIQLVPGFHVPLNSKVSSDFTRSNSRATSLCSNDEFNMRRERVDSVSSRGYDENYPPLGNERSGPSSVVSFSSLTTPKNKNCLSTTSSVEETMSSLSLSQRRDHKNMKFPERGCTKRPKSNQ